MKQGVVGSVMAARDMVVQRPNGHEMFGYDFMVDTNFNVWLIEVNSSPCMEHSTKVTGSMVPEMMHDLMHMVHECENGTSNLEEATEGCLNKCGKFELIYAE